MTIARWNPPVAPTRREQFLLKRLGRARKLFGFLRVHRHELFNDAFQEELASMYVLHLDSKVRSRRLQIGQSMAIPPGLQQIHGGGGCGSCYRLRLRISCSARNQSCSSWPGSRPRPSYSS